MDMNATNGSLVEPAHYRSPAESHRTILATRNIQDRNTCYGPPAIPVEDPIYNSSMG